MKTTTVSIDRSVRVGNKRYYGGTQQVALDDAAEIVKQGAGRILDKEVRDELKNASEDAPQASTPEAPKVESTSTNKPAVTGLSK